MYIVHGRMDEDGRPGWSIIPCPDGCDICEEGDEFIYPTADAPSWRLCGYGASRTSVVTASQSTHASRVMKSANAPANEGRYSALSTASSTTSGRDGGTSEICHIRNGDARQAGRPLRTARPSSGNTSWSSLQREHRRRGESWSSNDEA